MAIVEQAGRCQTITAANHGDMFKLGNASQEVGGWTIILVPSPDFLGGINTLGRLTGPDAALRNAPYFPAPYRQVCINNVGSDYTFSSALISTSSTVQVPANGLSIAFLVTCTAGSADVYSMPLQGATAP